MTNFTVAQQHTICYVTLRLIDVLFRPKCWSPDSFPMIEKVTRWREEAMAGLAKKELSAGARRAANKMYDTCKDFYQKEGAGELTSSIFLCAAATLLFDCKSVCQSWAHGRAWYYLDKIITATLKESLERYPESGEAGTKLYEDMCIAGGF